MHGDGDDGDREALEDLQQQDEELSEALTRANAARAADDEKWENVTADGKVRKAVTTEGSGPTPELHSVCIVHYIGRLRSSGTVFMDTRAEKQGEPVHIVAGRDCVTREQGLHLAVARMRVGEAARVEVAPEYGYGELGSFSFPSVPPNEPLDYDLELLAAEPPEDKPRAEMFYEERLEAVQRKRQRANATFATGAHREALLQYQAALTYMDEDFLMQLHDWFLDKAHAVKAPVLLNIAACQLQLQDWDGVITATSDALAIADKSEFALRAKALFRRARARNALGQTDAALQDLVSALLLCPNDPAIAKELTRLRSQRRGEQRAVDSLFKDKLKAKPAPEGSAAPRQAALPAHEDASRAWDSTTDELSYGERAFNWIADMFVRLLAPLWRWLQWRPAELQRVPRVPQPS